MIRQLAHVCFYTDRLEEMKKFYVGSLGLRYAFPLSSPDGKVFGIYLDAGNSSFIEVFDRKGAQAMWGGDDKSITRGSGYRHLCFEVTGLDEFCAGLSAGGVTTTQPVTGMDGSRQAWTSDPDGNPIELMEYTHASAQLKRR